MMDDDETLGWKIIPEGWQINRAEVGRRARAALTGPEVTLEEVAAFLIQRRIEASKDGPGNYSDLDMVLAALRHFARAPGGKVPSVEELKGIFQKAMNDEETKLHGNLETKLSYYSVRNVCAETAHAMMQRIGGREEMMIDGLDVNGLWNEWNKCAPPDGRPELSVSGHQILNEAFAMVRRLATTPRRVDDPDKEARELYIRFLRAKNNLAYENCKWDWDNLNDRDRNGWRAVAKGKADE